VYLSYTQQPCHAPAASLIIYLSSLSCHLASSVLRSSGGIASVVYTRPVVRSVLDVLTSSRLGRHAPPKPCRLPQDIICLLSTRRFLAPTSSAASSSRAARPKANDSVWQIRTITSFCHRRLRTLEVAPRPWLASSAASLTALRPGRLAPATPCGSTNCTLSEHAAWAPTAHAPSPVYMI